MAYVPDFFDAIHAFMALRAPEPRFGVINAFDNFMRQRIAGQYPNFDLRQSITPVMFAAFHHQDRAVPVMELVEEGMPVAAVTVMIAQGGRTMEGEIHYLLRGHPDLPFQTLVIMLRPVWKQLFY